MNQGQVNSEVAGAQANGKVLQNQYNHQAAQQYNNYQANQNQSNSAYNNLLTYTKGMSDPAQAYGQSLAGAQQMYGFDPKQLLQANKNLANTNTTLANLPQAAQAQGNYYGTTAGAQANNYAQQAGNLQALLSGQSNTVNAFQSVLGATQNQANQQATLGLQGQQAKSQNYQKLYDTSVNQMQVSGKALSDLQTLQQQQGFLTSQQVKNYQDAYSSYLSAQAAQAQAAASMVSAQGSAAYNNAQAQLTQQQYDFNKQQHTNQQSVLNLGNSNSGLGGNTGGMNLQGYGGKLQ